MNVFFLHIVDAFLVTAQPQKINEQMGMHGLPLGYSGFRSLSINLRRQLSMLFSACDH